MASLAVVVILAIAAILVSFYIALSCTASATNLNSKNKKGNVSADNLKNDKNNMMANTWLSVFLAVWLLLLTYVMWSYTRDRMKMAQCANGSCPASAKSVNYGSTQFVKNTAPNGTNYGASINNPNAVPVSTYPTRVA